MFPRRVRWTEGRFANVDGIPFQMSVRTRTSPALFAAFTIDPDRAAEMLPGEELHPCRILTRGLLVLAVVNYLDTPIGTYVEFCIGILVTRGLRPAPPLLSLAAAPLFGTGVYIYDLPVSTEVSVKGGLGIWGMPKRRANLDFVIGDDRVSSQYDLDGQLVARVDVPRPRRTSLPMWLNGVGYGDFRGMLNKSLIYMRGTMGLSLFAADARLLLGDHPRADPLKRLDIDPRPLVTGFAPRFDGVLDDHVETWFLISESPPGEPQSGIDDVAGLGLSREWPPPPDRATSDRLMAELTPDQRVGRQTRPPMLRPERQTAKASS
jgi:hypothetical protein